MSVREQIEAIFKQARIDRDEPTKNVIGMLKSKVLLELKSGRNVEDNDALWLDVISAYAKQLGKTIAEFEKVGDRGREALEEARFELTFCQRFLPSKLGEAETEALVRALAAQHAIADPKQQGKLIGLLMKDHKDHIDGDVARRVAHKVLSGG